MCPFQTKSLIYCKNVIVGLSPDDCIIHFECVTIPPTVMEQISPARGILCTSPILVNPPHIPNIPQSAMSAPKKITSPLSIVKSWKGYFNVVMIAYYLRRGTISL